MPAIHHLQWDRMDSGLVSYGDGCTSSCLGTHSSVLFSSSSSSSFLHHSQRFDHAEIHMWFPRCRVRDVTDCEVCSGCEIEVYPAHLTRRQALHATGTGKWRLPLGVMEERDHILGTLAR